MWHLRRVIARQHLAEIQEKYSSHVFERSPPPLLASNASINIRFFHLHNCISITNIMIEIKFSSPVPCLSIWSNLSAWLQEHRGLCFFSSLTWQLFVLLPVTRCHGAIRCHWATLITGEKKWWQKVWSCRLQSYLQILVSVSGNMVGRLSSLDMQLIQPSLGFKSGGRVPLKWVANLETAACESAACSAGETNEAFHLSHQHLSSCQSLGSLATKWLIDKNFPKWTQYDQSQWLLIFAANFISSGATTNELKQAANFCPQLVNFTSGP